jgi:probable addiction module antidote protein
MSTVKPLDLAPFDASDYLDSEELIAEYLAVALADPDPSAFLVAVSDVAKARGMAQVAADAGLGRESLYKTLRPGAQPRFDTVRHVLDALGVRLSVARMEPKPGP